MLELHSLERAALGGLVLARRMSRSDVRVLQGEAQREVVRVTIDCCLQEGQWNPYYAALLRNVLGASQGHCVTAQFCIWDHLKEIGRQTTRRIKNLALLVAHLIVSRALPLACLRVRHCSMQ